MIYIIMGLQGAGKDYLQNMLTQKTNCSKILSFTTRKMRASEKPGREYYFISEKKFLEDVGKGKIFEYRIYNKSDEGTVFYGSDKIHKDLVKVSNFVTILDGLGALEYIKEYGKENCEIINVGAPRTIRERRVKQRDPQNFNDEEFGRREEADYVNIENVVYLLEDFGVTVHRFTNEYNGKMTELLFELFIRSKLGLKLNDEEDSIIENSKGDILRDNNTTI